MRKGTTPTLVLTLDVDARTLEHIYVTLAQGGVKITKTGEDITVAEDGGSVSLTLTQEETLSFAAGAEVQVQIRAVTQGGAALATNIVSIPVERILWDEVI